MPGIRKRDEQFKLYLSTEEKAALLALARERKCAACDVLRTALEKELQRATKAPKNIQEARSATAAASGVDAWLAARRAKRAARKPN
jgi:hypothetical protein